jgi:hemerythrin-like domain-containing protein
MKPHVGAEETLINPEYRLLIPDVGNKIGDQCDEDHKELNKLINKLANTEYFFKGSDDENGEFEREFGRLIELFNSHAVEKEEKQYFPLLEKYASIHKLRDLGKIFTEAKKAAGSPLPRLTKAA